MNKTHLYQPLHSLDQLYLGFVCFGGGGGVFLFVCFFYLKQLLPKIPQKYHLKCPQKKKEKKKPHTQKNTKNKPNIFFKKCW